ncbi:hypothetical protein GIB67_034115 [Kingdonia uniflora]|uniref:Aminotransferase-like plant mobile domain-containing protein n=1 Tax=Kingdonia uniflora TaxID=39325 RepID=A0A7J7M6B8_9MAGN|nr:hypothetical protein GIB67_034115 [Kingdonia uniflora]
MRPHDTFIEVIKVWKDIYTILPVRDAVVNIFGQFMDIRLGNSNNQLIQALTKSWWPTTHTLMFPCAEIGVTLLDFTMLISLSIGRYLTQLSYDDACLDTVVTTGGAITGFSQLLEYWFYEYCGVGHPIVKEEVKFSAYLRLRAWERGNRRKTNNQATNLFILGRYHIDHRTIETITWEPWLESAVSEIDDLTGKARILLDPSLSMLPHIRPAALQEIRKPGFLDCEQFVIGEERETYASYWAEQTLEDLQLRRGRDVRVVPLPLEGGARTRLRGSGLQTRGGGAGRRGRGTGDDYE